MKMVLGYPCGSAIVLDNNDIIEAKRRIIYDFAFIGLTEEFEASIKLFHKQFGPSDSRATVYENIHLRKNQLNTKDTERSLRKQLEVNKFRDRFDEEIYGLASTIFYSRCHYYNITTNNKFI